MPNFRAARQPSRITVQASVLIALVGIYLARQVLVPIALAVLISFVLAPLVWRFERWGLPRIAAVLIVVLASVTIVVGIGIVVAGQIVQLAESVPQYEENIRRKIATFRENGNGAIDRLDKAGETLDSLEEELSGADESTKSKDTGGGKESKPTPRRSNFLFGQPIPVEIIQPRTSPLTIVRSAVGSVAGVLATGGLVLLFVVVMLVQREDLRDRLIRLIGQRQVNITTQALDDAITRLSRYLLMQAAINATTGLAIGVGLYFIGVPMAMLWGLIASLMRYVPYVGPWVGALLPTAVSLAVFDGWTPVLMTMSWLVVVELISNNVLEPWLYGSGTGVSPLAVLVAAVFWAWMWGPIGLILAMPLTVCAVVIGQYVPQLAFLSVLLGNAPVLEPKVRFYQRLLAGDQDEATDMADEAIKDDSAIGFYQTVLIPALGLAEQDRHAGNLDETREAFIWQSVRELIEDVEDRGAAGTLDDARPTVASSVVCLPARDSADEIAGKILALTLERKQIPAEGFSARSLTGEMLIEIERLPVKIVCVSVVPPMGKAHARYLCKRLRARFPGVKLVVCLWNVSVPNAFRERLAEIGVDRVVNGLAEATVAVEQLLRRCEASQTETCDEERPSVTGGESCDAPGGVQGAAVSNPF